MVHYSRGCYSDVGDARLCRELVKEEEEEGGVGGPATTKSRRKLINAEINKQLGPEFFMSLEKVLDVIPFRGSLFSRFCCGSN